VSEVIDANFTAAERDKLLGEVRARLPAFLHRGATEQHDPAGDIKELLNLEERDLQWVISVHLCLDEAVLRFGEQLREGLRNPITSSIRPPEVSQSVRGPIDWSATVARRALEAGNPALFVVRPARRIFDTPENQALAWLIARLQAAVQQAAPAAEDAGEDEEAAGWYQRIERLSVQLQLARRVQWLRGVPAELPTPQTLKRLKAARSAFYAEVIPAAIESILRLRTPSEQELTDVLCRRYFRPKETWRLFEVAIALRLAREFAGKSLEPRKTRLLVGAGRAAYARYGLADGGEVALMYQAWPRSSGESLRAGTASRHGFKPGTSRPDLFIVRTGAEPDCAILELKATYSAGYLGAGLSQLLGYIAERPEVWKKQPCGWLVAPESSTFTERAAEDDELLWVISAEAVAERAAERFG
jgi:hypothetical protein